MKEALEHVKKFNELFGLPVGEADKVLECPRAQQILQYDLLIEEVEEFREAAEAGNKVKIADALGDVLFVVLSSAIAHGLHHHSLIENVLHEICRSNLTKVDGDKPIYREDGKVMKGKNYEEPRLQEILLSYVK